MQIGHRHSIDLDLFTTESFDKPDLLDLLNDNFKDVIIESEGTNMLITALIK